MFWFQSSSNFSHDLSTWQTFSARAFIALAKTKKNLIAYFCLFSSIPSFYHYHACDNAGNYYNYHNQCSSRDTSNNRPFSYKKEGMTLNIWQNFFHIARIFCTPNIHYVKILHIKFEEIPIIDARVTSLQT